MKQIVPITLKEANAFVNDKHRHHGGVVGCKFAIGLQDNNKLMADSSKTNEANYQTGTTRDINFVVTNNTDGSNYVSSVTMPVEAIELMATVKAVDYYIRLIDEAETTQSKERYHCIAEALYSRLTEMEERLIKEQNNG